MPKQSAFTFVTRNCSYAHFDVVTLGIDNQRVGAYFLYIFERPHLWTRFDAGREELMLSRTRRKLHRELECHPP